MRNFIIFFMAFHKNGVPLMGSFNLRSSDFPPHSKVIEHVKQTYLTEQVAVTNILELNDRDYSTWTLPAEAVTVVSDKPNLN